MSNEIPLVRFVDLRDHMLPQGRKFCGQRLIIEDGSIAICPRCKMVMRLTMADEDTLKIQVVSKQENILLLFEFNGANSVERTIFS